MGVPPVNTASLPRDPLLRHWSRSFASLFPLLAGLTLLCDALLRNPEEIQFRLSAYTEQQILCKELVLLALTAGILTLLAAVADPRRRLRAAGRILVGAFVALYLLSWMVYASERTFISADGLHFFLADLWANLRHVFKYSPSRAASGLLLALCAGAGTLALWRLGCRRLPPRAATVLNTLSLLFVGFALAWFPFHLPRDLGADVPPTVEAMYRNRVSHLESRESGPLSVLVNGLRRGQQLSYLPEAQVDRFFVHPPRRVPPDASLPPGIAPVNVILVVVESMRAEVVGMERDGIAVTPHLSRLAREGLWCRSHYSQATYSQMADIAVISGIYPYIKNGVYLYERNVAWPRPRLYDALSRFGYATAIVSSQNERWGNMIHYLVSDRLDLLFHSENARQKSYTDPRDRGFADFSATRGAAGKLRDEYTLTVAEDFIREQRGRRPFFVSMNFQNPHFPYLMAEGYERVFSRDGEVPEDVSFAKLGPELLDPMYRRYLDSMRSADMLIGRLLAFLEAEGLRDQTMIVVTGDTGQSFGEHGLSGHGGPLYDEVLRTPLVFNGPGVEARTIDVPTQHADIAPSILSLLGLHADEGFQGTPVTQRTADDPVFFFAHGPLANQVGVRLGKRKLLRSFDSDQRFAFDLTSDPLERLPLAVRPDQPENYQLAVLLDAWLRAQLEYYRDRSLHGRAFAPRLAPPSARATAP